MKKTRTLLAGVMILVAGLSIYALAAPGGTSSDPDSRIIEIAFSTTTTYEFKGSGSFFTPTSIAVVFTGGSVANTVDIDLTRDGIERDLLDYTYTGRTVIWYLPNSFFFKAGDVITITNSDGSPALATLNLQF